jgi:hypothetical protein
VALGLLLPAQLLEQNIQAFDVVQKHISLTLFAGAVRLRQCTCRLSLKALQQQLASLELTVILIESMLHDI